MNRVAWLSPAERSEIIQLMDSLQHLEKEVNAL